MEENDLYLGDLGLKEEKDTYLQQKPEEGIEKKKYIDEHIISKGLNLEDLSRSITLRTGLTINEISLSLLKKEIDFFKKDQKKEELNNKLQKTNIVKELYSPEHYELETLKQPKNKLLTLEDENKKINPAIVDSHQEISGGLLGKKIVYYFNIKCPELNTLVGRTLEDFEFFKKILNERYPYKFIPPIFPKSAEKEYSHEIYKRYLNRFLQYISQRKILRTSPITLEFLELDSNSFYKYKKKLTNNKYICKYNMENYINMKGNLNIDFTQEKINEAEQLYKKIEATKSIYKSLNISLLKIVDDLNNLEKHMKQASDAFSALSNYTKESNQSPLLTISYDKLKDIFSQWSASYNKQNIFLNNNFRETFDYLNLQIIDLAIIEKQHMESKKDYEKTGIELYNKKEKLFFNQKYNEWELSEDDKKNIEFLKSNKKSAFKAMLPGMTNLSLLQKIQMACSTIIVKKEYEIFIKRQGNMIKEYLLSLKDKNKELLSDAYNLCSLFNIELDEGEGEGESIND